MALAMFSLSQTGLINHTDGCLSSNFESRVITMSGKNNWTYWSHLAMLQKHIDDGGNLQRLGEFVKNDYLLTYPVDGRPLNLNDPALGYFLKLCGIPNPSAPDVELYDIKRGLQTWYSANVTNRNPKLGFETIEEFDRLFELRSSEAGWSELDRLTRLLGEVTFSKIVDSNKTVIFDPADPELGCLKPYYAQSFKMITSQMDPSFEMMSYEDELRMNCTFIASSFERLMKNVMDFATNFQLDKVEPNQHPDYIVIYKGPSKIITFPLQPHSEGKPGLEMDYTGLLWERTGQGLLKSVLNALPSEAHYKVRGTMFTVELGV
jgi:hypothetical protein